jgi:hypothetical protein
MVCPVCEHEQDQERGVECSVCGKSLLAVAAPADPTPQLDGLEATRAEALPAPEPERFADLEPTALEPTALAVPEPGAPGDPAPWIERTAREPVLAANVEELEVERTAAAPDAVPGRDLLEPPTCRYCRAPAAPGEVFCALCGLKLAVYRSPGAEERRGTPRRCRFCGASGAGDACPSCGARLPAEA